MKYLFIISLSSLLAAPIPEPMTELQKGIGGAAVVAGALMIPAIRNPLISASRELSTESLLETGRHVAVQNSIALGRAKQFVKKAAGAYPPLKEGEELTPIWKVMTEKEIPDDGKLLPNDW